MVTTAEIRKRVEDADRDRIKRRADAAEAIATAVEQRTKARDALAELEASIAAQVKASEAVMSLEELAEFTGIPITELRSTGRGTRSRKSTRTTSPRGRSRATPAELAPKRGDARGGTRSRRQQCRCFGLTVHSWPG